MGYKSTDINTEHDYRRDFNAYLKDIDHSKIKSLEDILTPDDKYGALRTPEGKVSKRDISKSSLIDLLGQFGLAELERAIFDPIDDEEAFVANATMREASGARGIDKALKENDVDILLGPGGGTLYSLSAAAGESVKQLQHL